jgi:Tol biopolymer transport system component
MRRLSHAHRFHTARYLVSVEFHEGTNMAASPSPDGKRIVFSAQGALWVIPIGGGIATRITDWHLEPTAPVWSPNGKRIAFQNYAPEGNYHIWTVDPDGADLRADDRAERRPRTGLDPGRQRAGVSSDRSNDGQYKIWRVPLERPRRGRSRPGPGAESNPVVSPDGKQLAYVDGRQRVFTRQLSAAAHRSWWRTAPRPPGRRTDRAWCTRTRPPAGAARRPSDVAAKTSSRSRCAISRTAASCTPPTARSACATPPAAAPADVPFSADAAAAPAGPSHPKDRGFDNGAAPVTRHQRAGDVARRAEHRLRGAERRVGMRSARRPRRLTNDSDRDGSPQWTPDGTLCLFLDGARQRRPAGGRPGRDRHGARTRLAAIPGRRWSLPKMSPTGDRIAYTTLLGPARNLEPRRRHAEVIAPVGSQVSTPQWLPDGQHILLVDNERINNRFREGYNKLRVIDLATGQGTFHAVAPAPRQISERDEGAAVLSPDGTRVAFIMDSLLHVMPLNPTARPPARRGW